MQHPPPVREDMRVVDYLKEIADDAANRLEGSQGFEEERMSPTSVLDQVAAVSSASVTPTPVPLDCASI